LWHHHQESKPPPLHRMQASTPCHNRPGTKVSRCWLFRQILIICRSRTISIALVFVTLTSDVAQMNTNLADYLDRFSIEFETISKSEKVRLLSLWSSEFPGLLASARHGDRVSNVHVDNAADELMKNRATDSFFVLPDDDSDMQSLRCCHRFVPDLSILLSDTVTKCDEIVIIDSSFDWSCVLVNHGRAGVGRYYMRRG